MVRYCAAFNCSNKEGCRDKEGKCIAFHKFPLNNESLCREWVAAVRRKRFRPSRSHLLCSEHFEEDTYYPNYVNRRKLKETAVPSVFNFSLDSAKDEHETMDNQGELAHPMDPFEGVCDDAYKSIGNQRELAHPKDPLESACDKLNQLQSTVPEEEKTMPDIETVMFKEEPREWEPEELSFEVHLKSESKEEDSRGETEIKRKGLFSLPFQKGEIKHQEENSDLDLHNEFSRTMMSNEEEVDVCSNESDKVYPTGNQEKCVKGVQGDCPLQLSDTQLFSSSTNTDEMYYCSVCLKSFFSKKSLLRHVQCHEQVGFNCMLCSMTYTSNQHLQKHMVRVHEGIRYCCTMCSRSYTNQASLEEHVQTHEGKRYDCSICPKSYCNIRRLQNHMLLHK